MASPLDEFNAAVSALEDYLDAGQALADDDNAANSATGLMVVADANAALRAISGGRTSNRIAAL